MHHAFWYETPTLKPLPKRTRPQTIISYQMSPTNHTQLKVKSSHKVRLQLLNTSLETTQGFKQSLSYQWFMCRGEIL